MTHPENPPASSPASARAADPTSSSNPTPGSEPDPDWASIPALDPDRTRTRTQARDRPPATGGRAARARDEPMTVRPLRDRRYVVETDGGSYVVDVAAGRCACPDHSIRGTRCKHLRRVAMAITAGDVPAPDERIAACGLCGRPIHVPLTAGGSHLCDAHSPVPGERVTDRETGEELVVVRVTTDRADAAETDEGRTVAAYPTNARYGGHEPVIDAVYAAALRPGADPADLDRYRFPASRLRRTGGDGDPDRSHDRQTPASRSADPAAER